MEIATLGNVTFEVSGDTVKTFSEYARKTQGRWALHEIVLKEPQAEFLGPGQGELSFNVVLNSLLGVDPEAELEQLRNMAYAGETAILVIGGMPVGKGEWYVESVDEADAVFDREGACVKVSAQLALKEYF